MLNLKQTRHSAGKLSVLFRSGKHVNMQNVYSYLRRKKLSPRVFEQARQSDDVIQLANHICARTPSPLPPASNLTFLPGCLQFKESILLSINRGYTYWVCAREELARSDIYTPDMFYSVRMCGLSNIDVLSLLLQHGLKLFRANRFSSGGSYIRAAFIFVEFHIKELSEARKDEQSLSWVFGLWKLLTSSLPHELSRALITHVVKVSQIYFAEMHPLLDILRCLQGVHREKDQESFLSFISSTWADAINSIRILLESSGLDAEACLPHSLWTVDNNGHCQFQDVILEFRRTEPIESWRQHVEGLSFPFCKNRQLHEAAPSHKDVLTLMRLNRSLVDTVDVIASHRLSANGDTQNVNLKKFLVKTANVTRLELSVGEQNHPSGFEDIRILSGDVYQVRYLHGPRSGEDFDAFKSKHNLDTHNFQILKNRFQATEGIETDKLTWFKWLQILEESLIGPWERGQRLQSVVANQSVRGKGLICTYLATKAGEIGIKEMSKGELRPENNVGDGVMSVDVGFLQN